MNAHVPTQNKSTLLVAGVSSRILVESAVNAGFDVIALDTFADCDTKEIAKQVVKIDSQQGQLNSQDLISVIDDLDLSDMLGFCYGAGFEMQPNILTEISQRLHLFGNNADVVSQCKDPHYFFGICNELKIPYPEVSFKPPKINGNWLKKTVGCSGGAEVKQYQVKQTTAKEDVYYQKHQAGTPVSCLFLAKQNKIEIVGFNEQWVVDATRHDYRYYGAMSHAEISHDDRQLFIANIESLSPRLGLRGINSCDAILHKGKVSILEINPRLSATMDLYPTRQGGLLAAHLSCFKQKNKQSVSDDLYVPENKVRAHQVYYADKKRYINSKIWPDWASDIPCEGAVILQNMPICTIKAEAQSSAEVKALLANRVSSLSSNLLN